MKKLLNDILFVFPVMVYYLFEAVIVGVFISLMWKFFLSQALGDVGYLQIVAIYWIVKMLFFDVFKLISGLNSAGSNMQREMEENPDEYYNEEHTEK